MLAWYIAPPTLVALINPHKGKFNVTAKGGLVEEEYVDWVISRPYIFLVLLNLVGVAVGIWRYFYGPPTEMLTVVVSMVWVFYNLIVLGGAVAVSVESKQVRRSHRVEMTMPAAIAPRRWSPLLVYRSGFLRRWFGGSRSTVRRRFWKGRK